MKALLFLNGNAAYFDETGEQITELQRLGWSGLHGYLERYPDGIVRLQGGVVDKELQPWLLRHLRTKPAPR
jgi:hypothetical protein